MSWAAILAIAGLLPLAVFLVQELADSKPDMRAAFRALAKDKPDMTMRPAAHALIMTGILFGTAPDIFVLLAPEFDGFRKVDRLLDFLVSPLLIGGLVLYRGSRAKYPRRAAIVWCGSVIVCGAFAFLFSAVAG